MQHSSVVVGPLFILTSHVFNVVVPVFKQLEAIEAFISGFKHIFSVLAPLLLEWPGGLVAEVDWNAWTVHLEKQVAPLNLGVGAHRLRDAVLACVVLSDGLDPF